MMSLKSLELTKSRTINPTLMIELVKICTAEENELNVDIKLQEFLALSLS